MPVKVLIVDDDVDLRGALSVILRSRFQVLEASGGLQALEILKRERPHLTLLDVSMPGMSGLEVLAAAKQLQPSLTVVMLTSQKDIETAVKALNLGAAEYVTKPFDAEFIRSEVLRLTGSETPPEDRPPWKVRP
jgi:DNA-binding NtrC family response regulator